MFAPTTSAYLENTAWGIISPNIVMIAVERISPTVPEVKSPIRIDRAEFTVTFPRRIVQRRRLPLLLIGRIFSAYLASYASCSLLNGPLVSNSKFLTSRPSNPKFRPENVPDRVARPIIIINCVGVTEAPPLPSSKPVASTVELSAARNLDVP